MKNFNNLVGSTSLSLISSTVIILPFIVFLKLGSSHTAVTILPFVVFYTFRMTGVFFIRGIKTKLNSYTLLKLAIYSGILGALFGITGTFISEAEVISGIFLGLSAAWLPMANTTINIYRRENDDTPPKNIWLTLVFLILLGLVVAHPIDYSYIIFFVLYGFMYLFALFSIKNMPKYEISSDDLEGYSYPYLILFIIFSILIFYLRSSRLLLSTVQFDYFVYGTFFLVICFLIFEIFGRNKVQRKIPTKLSYLTLINGAVGSYLFLFSSLYTAGYYGHDQLFTRFYLPYVFGIILSPKLKKILGTNVKPKALVGIAIGLLIVMLTPFFAVGILILSLFKSTLNHWLTDTYVHQDNLPSDKRIWVKFTVQGIGSIMHQFILMLVGSLIVIESQTSIKQFFRLLNQKTPTSSSKLLMGSWNSVASGILLFTLIIYALVAMKKNRNINIKNTKA